MTADSTPATKADLQEFMTEIQKQFLEFRTENNQRFDQMHEEFENRFHSLRDEIISHVNLLDENFRRDVFGAFEDRYEQLREVQQVHGKRLNKLEATLAI